MKQRILVTPRSATKSGHPSLAALAEGGFEVVFSRPGVLPTEEDLLQCLPGCVGYLAGVETISASVLENAKELKAISRNGTGRRCDRPGCRRAAGNQSPASSGSQRPRCC